MAQTGVNLPIPVSAVEILGLSVSLDFGQGFSEYLALNNIVLMKHSLKNLNAYKAILNVKICRKLQSVLEVFIRSKIRYFADRVLSPGFVMEDMYFRILTVLRNF